MRSVMANQSVSFHELTNGSDQVDTMDTPLNTKEANSCSLEFAACRAYRYVWLIAPPVLLLLGTMGNVISFRVMMRPSLRVTATGCYIAALAVADTIGIWTGLSRQFIQALTYDADVTIDIRELHPAVCKVQRFVLYTSTDVSVWLLVAVSLERFLAVSNSPWHKTFREVKHALTVIALTVLTMCAINVHLFWTRGREVIAAKNGTNGSDIVINCGYPHPDYAYFWTFYYGYISLTVYCLLPFICMASMNSYIAVVVLKMKRKFATLRQASGLSTASRRTATGSTKSTGGGGFAESQARSITIMLLAVSLYFLLVATPCFIFTIVEHKVHYSHSLEPEFKATMSLVDASVTVGYYCNHALNFFLYCLTGRRFRRELAAMYTCPRCRPGADDSDHPSTSFKYKHRDEISPEESKTLSAPHEDSSEPLATTQKASIKAD